MLAVSIVATGAAPPLNRGYFPKQLASSHEIWHTGSISHPDLLNGALPASASEVNALQQSVTPTGKKPTVKPRAMTKTEIRQTAADYAKAASNAMKAGFDGVQVQANYLYLIPQFLNKVTNL